MRRQHEDEYLQILAHRQERESASDPNQSASQGLSRRRALLAGGVAGLLFILGSICAFAFGAGQNTESHRSTSATTTTPAPVPASGANTVPPSQATTGGSQFALVAEANPTLGPEIPTEVTPDGSSPTRVLAGSANPTGVPTQASGSQSTSPITVGTPPGGGTTPSAASSPVSTVASTATASASATSTATVPATATAIASPTPPPTSTPLPTSTPVPTATPSSIPTSTPEPLPTETSTPPPRVPVPSLIPGLN
jgi:hypothetical protein